MVSDNGTVSISIHLGEGDKDVAEWFNMIQEAGQSRSLWGSALLLAYDRGEKLDVGCVTTPKDYRPQKRQPETPAPYQPLLYGNGPIDTGRHRNDGWEIKGEHTEFIPGSVVVIRLTNKRVIKAYHKLRDEGWYISSVIKYTLKESLRRGDEQELPSQKTARDYVAKKKFKHLLWPNKTEPGQVRPTVREEPPVSRSPPPEMPEPSEKPAKPNPLLDFIG